MSTVRVVNIQHTDATEPNIVLEADGTTVFASGITISGGTNLTVSGTAEFASGTVSAPSITFIDDNNTGIYEPAVDTVAITTAATERLRVDSSGNVGIGTTSPAGKLTLKTTNSNGAPTAWNNSYFLISEGNTSTSFGLGLSLDTTNNEAHISSLTPGTQWDPINYRASQHKFFVNDASSNEVARIDSSGRLLVGTSSARTDYFNNSLTAMLQVEGTNFGGAVDRACVSIVNNNNVTDNEAPVLVFGRSRGSTVNSKTLAGNGTRCGYISFQGADGSDMVEAASIAGEVDGTSGANDMPGRLVFSTTADGSSSPTERMRIDSSGRLLLNSGSDVRMELGTNGTSGTNDRNHLRGDGDNMKYNCCADGGHIFETNGTERMRILPTGGLTFNGDTAAANALDDYEEGTWTPIEPFGISLSINFASYTKIGRRVVCDVDLTYASNSTGGNATITLPFAMESTSKYGAGIAGWSSNPDGVKVHVGANIAYWMKLETGSTSGNTHLSPANLSGYRILATFEYDAA